MAKEPLEYYAARLEEIPEGGSLLVRAGGVEVGIFKWGGELYAYENRCSHQGGPVCQGQLLGRLEEILAPDGRVIGERFSEETIHLICPWHGWEFDLRTGVCHADKGIRLRKIETVVRDQEVYIKV